MMRYIMNLHDKCALTQQPEKIHFRSEAYFNVVGGIVVKKHRRGKVIRKSSRVMALLIALLMITALIVPMGVRASETADGSASGASETVAEESHDKEEKVSEKEEEKDSSDSDEKKEESAKDASSEEKSSESGKTEQKEKTEDTSSEAEAGNEKSSDADTSDTDKKKEDKSEADSGASDKAESEDKESKDASAAETKKEEEKSGGADTGNPAATSSSDAADSSSSEAAGSSDGTSKKSASDQDARGSDDTAEEAAEVVQTDDQTTITFRSKDVTVIADKKAFNTEVTMRVKKVTDPEQLLKMVTALNGEGGSYTVKAYNVSFYDKNGKEVEPSIPVQVNVNTKVSAPSKSKVVHVKDDDKTEILDADIDKSGASFELDSFSDIGVATEAKTKIPGSSFDVYLGEERSDEYTVDDLPAGPISEKNLPAVEGYVFKNATAGDDTVEEIGTITDAEGKVYVYYTTRD